MAVTLGAMLLCLLAHGSVFADGQVEKGCMKWSLDKTNDENVCCDICHPGNRLVTPCGPSPADLCTPCKPQTYSAQPKSLKCARCDQCVGAQVLVKNCTLSSNTVCGCQKGLTCGDAQCSFCVNACGKGQEPSQDGVCRTCPNGTFNDQPDQRCKPWSTRCPNPDQKIVALGDAFSDIKCEDVGDIKKYEWSLVWTLTPSLVLVIIIIIIFSVSLKIQQERKSEKAPLEAPVIGTPTDTDDHMTLIAIECSFHEAEQEQGSSLDSLYSENSTKELVD